MRSETSSDFDPASTDDYRSKWKPHRFSKYSIVALLVVSFLVPLCALYFTPQTYTVRAELELGSRHDGPPPSQSDDWAEAGIRSTVEQVLLSRGIADKVIKQNKLSELPEFDPILRGVSPVMAAAGLVGLIQDPFEATPYERILNSYYERLNVVGDPRSSIISIEFRSLDPFLARATAQSIAEIFLTRSDVRQAAKLLGSLTTRKDSALRIILSETVAATTLVALLLLLAKSGIAGRIWSLLVRFRYRVAGFSLSALALFALGVWLNPPEYRSNTQILLSDTPLNYEGKNLSLGDEIEAQNSYLRSDRFATDFITHYKLADLQGADEETRERVLRVWRQRLRIRTLDRSRVVSIEYQFVDPEKAARVVSLVADFYIKWRQVLRKQNEKRGASVQTLDPKSPDEVISSALVSDVRVYPSHLVIFGLAVASTMIVALLLVVAKRLHARTMAGDRSSSLRPTSREKIAVLVLVVVPFVINIFIQHTIHLTRDQAGTLNLLVLFTWALGYYVLYRHLQRRRRTQSRLNSEANLFLENERDYFLYLRSFVTSNRLLVRNRLPSLSDRLLVGSFWDLEFALAHAFEAVCPLVAIGLNGDGVGASKVSVDDHHWKQAFARMASKARLIFIVPFATTGTLHEMTTLASDAALLRKTVWVMPPSYFGLRWSVLFSLHGRRWDKVRKVLAIEGVELPRYSRRGGLFIMGQSGSPVKQIATDDFSEGRMRPFAQSLLSAIGCCKDDEYARQLDAIRFPKRHWREFLSEWLFKRWLGDRLAGFFSTALLSSFFLALVFRTFLIQPFDIPSGSMESTLLVGDYLFVSKFDYGYTHYSIPFSPEVFNGRIFGRQPARGDVVVFRLPRDDTTDYIKRVIGMPGDHIQMQNGRLYINGEPVKRERLSDFVGEAPCGSNDPAPVKRWKETLPNGVSYQTLDCTDVGFYDNTAVYTVPQGHFFLVGDNRDNSTDSRALSAVGYVPFENLIGRARMIYFSVREGEAVSMLWRWPAAVRWTRLVKFIH